MLLGVSIGAVSIQYAQAYLALQNKELPHAHCSDRER